MIINDIKDINDIQNLSITELKQLLSQVNAKLKMNKPKRVAKVKSEKIAEKSELALCNEIAATFTGNKQVNQEVNGKLKADIQIQKDILDYMNNGGMIKTAKSRKGRKELNYTTLSLYKKSSI